MAESRLLKTGVIGAVIVGLCCVTPVLVVLFAAFGLSALTGYLDIVLFPLLGLFIATIIYALVKRQPA